jgi:hypothetical protein
MHARAIKKSAAKGRAKYSTIGGEWRNDLRAGKEEISVADKGSLSYCAAQCKWHNGLRPALSMTAGGKPDLRTSMEGLD